MELRGWVGQLCLFVSECVCVVPSWAHFFLCIMSEFDLSVLVSETNATAAVATDAMDFSTVWGIVLVIERGVCVCVCVCY